MFNGSFFIASFFEPHYFIRQVGVPPYYPVYDGIPFWIPYRPEREALLPRFRRRNP